jgi:hypothetical protein
MPTGLAVEHFSQFILEQSPYDTKVIGLTWKHPNAHGGPDRRFKDNRQLPICEYGRMTMMCNGYKIMIITSKASAARESAAELRKAIQEMLEPLPKHYSVVSNNPPLLNRIMTPEETEADDLRRFKAGQ